MNKPFDFFKNTRAARAGISAVQPAPASLAWREPAALAKLFAGLCLVMMAAALPMRQAVAQTTVNIEAVPLLALKSAPGLVMLTMSRDHRLFYAAYNDTSDINGDGAVDVGFKPNITYYGNFVSDRCYDYITSGANNPLYRPIALATAAGCKVGATQRWHGNWLNWATTSRMDALRRVLYGGYRVVDNATTAGSPSFTSTVLQGAFIPKDSHVWGKEFRPGRDTYDITQYTTLAAPSNAATRQHLFVVVSPGGNASYPFLDASTAPVLRYITDADQTTERIWLWASADVAQGIGSNPANFSKGGGRSSVSATDRTLRVEACVPIGGVREAGCTGYPTASPTVWKPTGTLHDFSVKDQLKFGLITGSYQKNYSGGVVRRNIGSFSDEIVASTGQFASTNDGIARTIDRITIHGWGGSQYDCGYRTTANRNEAECKSWGAPVGEMMYEGLRYFSGKSAGTSAYVYGGGSADSVMNFPALPAWQNPFRAKASGGSPICSRPVQMVIADPLSSFDSDQLPGAYFTPTANFGTALGANDLTGLNVVSEANALWTAEALGTRNIFIGQSDAVSDGNPTAKSANSFARIRGHAPDETQSQGSFYSASVARFGRVTGVPVGAPTGTPVVPTVPGQKVDTIAVALGSLTPKIELVDGTGKKVSIVPLSKAVGGGGINKTPGTYQATGAITGFYYANNTPTSVSAVVNFSDGDQGTDNETDAQVRYDISLSGSTVTINMTQLDRNPGGIQSNLGYVISGTTKDGLYLETRTNKNGTATPISAGDVYYLDTLAGQDPAPAPPSVRMNGNGITHAGVPGGIFPYPYDNNPAIVANVCPSFDPGSPRSATQPTSGGNNAQRIAQRAYNVVHINAVNACLPSWDKPTTRTFTLSSTASAAGSFLPQNALWYAAKYGGAGVVDAKGDPTNYFRISNPAELPDQMGKAFRSAAALAAVASTSVVGVGQRSMGSAAIYQANYDSLTWSSRLYAFPVATSGSVSDTPIWEASSKIPAPALRTKLFLGQGGTTAPKPLVAGGFASLSAGEQLDFVNAATYAYLLGDKSGEERKGGTFRNRGSTAAADYGSVLGDIVNSDPQIISRRDHDYAASDATYTSFLSSIDFEMLAVGTNNGFFHIFDAEPDASGGGELLGFMPQAATPNIKYLPDPGYIHQNFVDGAVTVGHAKIPVPGDPASNWRSVVVAAGGTGAQTVFAINATSKTFTANSILWEMNPASLALSFPAEVSKFGKIMGRPGIGKLSNGTWVAIFGNGYNSTSGTANLFVVNLATGALLKVIPTNALVTGNGMGATEIVRKSSGNRDTIEFVYGSDYKGNVWRFDLSDTNMANWSASGALIYKTPTGRPITAEIKVGPAPTSPLTTGGKMIYFGTGSYLSSADPTNTTVQALYGIYDNLIHTSSSTAYVTDASLTSMAVAMPAPVGGVTSDVRTTALDVTPNWYEVSGKKGWIVPLTGTNVTPGERVIAPPIRYTVSGTVDAFLFTSIVPSTDDCEAGLDAWITGVDAMTGAYRKVFGGANTNNSIRVRGGSPRGVFVLQDSGPPALYISQTIFNNTIATTSYTTSAGGQQTVCINGVCGTTQVIKVDLTAPPEPPPCTGPTCAPCTGPHCTGGSSTGTRQIWRQLR